MAGKVAKYHLSLRVEQDTAARIDELREADESQTGVYNRVLKAGVEALGRADREEQEEGESALVEALRAHIRTLETQLDRKDEQLEAVTSSLRAAQILHGNDVGTRVLEAAPIAQEAHEHAQDVPQHEERPAQEAPGGFFARLRFLATGR